MQVAKTFVLLLCFLITSMLIQDLLNVYITSQNVYRLYNFFSALTAVNKSSTRHLFCYQVFLTADAVCKIRTTSFTLMCSFLITSIFKSIEHQLFSHSFLTLRCYLQVSALLPMLSLFSFQLYYTICTVTSDLLSYSMSMEASHTQRQESRTTAVALTLGV